MSTPEALVKKLARLPHNIICPNCGTTKKFGFSTVCIKFLTFVCNDCKASHAAYSHRCKSLTMSTWSAEEVQKLKQAGNEVARRTWLAKAPPPGVGKRPKEGDDINKFKAFVVDVYERKMYYDASGAAPAGGGGGAPPAGVQTAIPLSGPVPTTTSRRVRQTRQAPPPQRRVEPAPAPAPAPVADLLDFSAAAPAVQAAPSNSFANFDAFSAQPPPAATAAAPSPVFDPFNNATPSAPLSKPAPAPTPTPVVAAAAASSDPFAGMTSLGTTNQTSTPAPASNPPKKSIMNSGSSGNASLISGMNQMANMASMQQKNGNMQQQQRQMGGMNFSGVPQQQQAMMGGGMNNNMNMMNMMGGQQGGGMNGMNMMMNNMNINGMNNNAMGMSGMMGGGGMNNMQMMGGMNAMGGGGMNAMGMNNNNMGMMGGMNAMGGMNNVPMSMMGGSTNSITTSFGGKPASQQQQQKIHDPFADLKF